MGVYIPNIEKPRRCMECFYQLKCKVIPRWVTPDFIISKNCPLIEVNDKLMPPCNASNTCSQYIRKEK